MNPTKIHFFPKHLLKTPRFLVRLSVIVTANRHFKNIKFYEILIYKEQVSSFISCQAFVNMIKQLYKKSWGLKNELINEI